MLQNLIKQLLLWVIESITEIILTLRFIVTFRNKFHIYFFFMIIHWYSDNTGNGCAPRIHVLGTHSVTIWENRHIQIMRHLIWQPSRALPIVLNYGCRCRIGESPLEKSGPRILTSTLLQQTFTFWRWHGQRTVIVFESYCICPQNCLRRSKLSSDNSRRWRVVRCKRLPKELKYCLINIQCITNKVDELNILLEQNIYELPCLSEH